MKYIDAEKLIAEIERHKLSNRYIDTEGYEAELLEIITSLQQEQPEGGCSEKPNNLLREQPEVGLEKALDEYYKNADFGPSEAIEYEIHKDIARHFAEWGAIHLNARKEDEK